MGHFALQKDYQKIKFQLSNDEFFGFGAAVLCHF